MASSPAVGILEKHAAALEAKVKAAENLKTISQGRALVVIMNDTYSDLNFKEGDLAAPRTIPAGDSEEFVTTNSIGHVTYVGSNGQGTPCQWYLGWNLPKNQVRVRCGSSSILSDNVSSSDSEGSISYYEDARTRTYAAAKIDLEGRYPTIYCVFGAER